jgi:hypothetical protein
MRALPRAHPLVLACVLVTIVVAGWGTYQARQGYQAYMALRSDITPLRAYAERDPMTYSSADLQHIERASRQLDDDLARLDAASSVPFGEGLLTRVPWLGARYQAGRDLIQLGRLLAPAGARGAWIGQDVLAAVERSGVSGAPAGEATWLDVIVAHEAEIRDLAVQLEVARALRQDIAVDLLPAGAQARVAELDKLLARADTTPVLNALPALKTALGAERPMRYLVLFPNPAEMRPAGGFPGDIALVTIERGQLQSYEFFNIVRLTQAYVKGRSAKVALPWPYEQFFRTDGYLIQDVVWSPEFTQVGEQFMAMYAETGWPAIDGVVAAQSSVASDLLRLVGPTLEIEVDGEARRITPDNLYDEIERQRRLRLDGVQATYHKEVMATIGTAIVERLKAADRAVLVSAATSLRAAAARRDLQIYATDSVVQSWLDDQRWTGRMTPDSATPTIGVAFGDLVAHKAGLRMQPRIELTLGPSVDGRREGRLDIYLKHTGTSEEAAFYAGFQRWWVEVYLPEGAVLRWTHDTPQPDPAAPNGGSYLIEIFPQWTGYASVTFTIPDAPSVLIRRQPGITQATFVLYRGGCVPPEQVTLTQDVRLDLAPDCAGDAR